MMMMLDFYLLLLLIRLHSTGDKETVSIYSVFYLKKEKKKEKSDEVVVDLHPAALRMNWRPPLNRHCRYTATGKAK